MKRFYLLLGLVLADVGGLLRIGTAQEYYAERPPVCEPGYKLVAETGFKIVEHACCKVVPHKKSKWVYCSKPDYFCIGECGKCGRRCNSCDGCGDCEGPFCREALLKKRIEWECGTKCVVEIIKEKVPCTVWRKVPCGSVESMPSALPPATIQAESPATTTVATPE